jgi:hypothetical protein
MKKKPKKGARPDAKPQTKLEPVESFFSFFSPPQVRLGGMLHGLSQQILESGSYT